MANMKKVDKAEMLSRLDELEKKVKELDVAMCNMREPVVQPSVFPVVPVADGKTVLTDKTLFAAVALPVVSAEVHECQVNTCKNMMTKPYERSSGRMWLCDQHKF